MAEHIDRYALLSDRVSSGIAGATAPFLLAISGPPGSGKSTLSRQLVEDMSRAGHASCHCPMDGFHLTNRRLRNHGLLSVKGRIDTFDGQAFSAAVTRLASREAFWWPGYSRRTHEPVAEGTRIDGTESLLVIEGNYILDRAEPWRSAATAYDLRVFIDVPAGILENRLRGRHKESGRDDVEIQRKIDEVDLPNARRIRQGLGDVDIIYRILATG